MSPPIFRIFKLRAKPQTAADDVVSLLDQAESAARGNDVEKALLLYAKLIAQRPDSALAHYKMANLRRDRGELVAALQGYDHAIAADPKYANAYCNRGVVLERLKQPEAALESYGRAIALNPADALAFCNRGSVLGELRRNEEALANYDNAISLNPHYAEAYCNRGVLLSRAKRWDEAIANYNRCIEILPDFFQAYFNRGDLFYQRRQWGAALADCDKAIELNPEHAESHCNRGVVLVRLRRLDAAMASFNRAIAIKPEFAQAYCNRAALFASAQLDEKALADSERAISLNPEYADALYQRGQIFMQMKRFEAAISDFKAAMTGEPDLVFLLGVLCHARMTICDWSQVEVDIQKLAEGIDAGSLVSAPMPLLALIDSPQLHRQAARIFAQTEALSGEPVQPIRPRPADGKIRIGYFSADFHVHPVAILMAQIFELHDRSKFEITAFSFGRGAPDAMRNRLEKAFTRFIDVRGNSDQEIASMARDLNIDIAVDLGGYTAGCRPMIFSLRAAPLQVNFLGYPGTLGVQHTDYIIGDPIVTPACHSAHYDEKIIWLPNCYLPNDTTREIAATKYSRAQLGLPDEGFVYCCFNNSYKITPEVFDTWMQILQSVEGSVLWLGQSNSSVADNLRAEAMRRGTDPARLVFAERFASWPEHLARHRAADLFLDTRPYNAHATAVDALWAGLPVLTCIGEGFAGRVASSLLTVLGLPELIAPEPAAYRALAIDLGKNPSRLALIREKLARSKSSAPLFDSRRYTRNLESAYSSIYERSNAGLSPEHLDVPDTG